MWLLPLYSKLPLQFCDYSAIGKLMLLGLKNCTLKFATSAEGETNVVSDTFFQRIAFIFVIFERTTPKK